MKVKVFLFVFFFLIARSVYALDLIRDAEIEEYLRDIISPILLSAGLKSNEVNLYLIKDNSINAFVYGGMNIFIHTGLIESSNTPNMLQGVMAHELGHITGAHLIKMQPQLTKALATYAISTLLGIGALMADTSASGTNAAIASTMLGQHIAQRNFLSFSRAQESEADRYALIYLKRSNISTEGMLELFKKLGSMQKTFIKDIDQYSVTHPLTEQRLNYFQENKFNGAKSSTAILHRHRLIQAKLLAYSKNNSLYTNAKVIHQNDTYNDYYLVHKYMLENSNSKAVQIAHNLLDKNKNNPFFHEVISMIYLKIGNLEKAYHYFKSAVNLASENLLLKHEFASFLIRNFVEKEKLSYAVFLLEGLKNTDEASVVLYQNLQNAYKKLGMEDYYLISRIEEVVLFDDLKNIDTGNRVEKMIDNVQALLEIKENAVIQQRLKRIKKIYESA